MFFHTNNEQKWEELPYNQNRKMKIQNEWPLKDNPIQKIIISPPKEKSKRIKIDVDKKKIPKQAHLTEKKKVEDSKSIKTEGIKDIKKIEIKKIKKIIKKKKKQKEKWEEYKKKVRQK